jgi:hypothetical protein
MDAAWGVPSPNGFTEHSGNNADSSELARPLPTSCRYNDHSLIVFSLTRRGTGQATRTTSNLMETRADQGLPEN